MLMMRSIIRRAALGTALATLVACGGSDAGTGVRASVTGTYQLATINSQPLPFTEQTSGAVVKITDGTLVARSDGTFSETLGRSTTSGTGTLLSSTTATGTYQVGNQVLVFTYSGTGQSLLGSLVNGGVSIQNGANSFEYKR
jgi:hypothetical protein